MKLYVLDTCPYCKQVTDKLEELGQEYEKISVPMVRDERAEVFKASGQYLVPVLIDGDIMLDDEVTILPYLDQKYGNK